MISETWSKVAVKVRESPTLSKIEVDDGDERVIDGADDSDTAHVQFFWSVPFAFSAITVKLCVPSCAELL